MRRRARGSEDADSILGTVEQPLRGTYCGGCGSDVREGCQASLRRLGARKVHWECWWDCNLSCQFCYRTEARPLETSKAKHLLAAVATAGAETLVFAGGDPSLRKDLGQLLGAARTLGLRTEVHTNAQHAPRDFREALAGVDCAGLSLDGPTAEVHDAFRDKPGNFQRVRGLLGFLKEARVPVIVRTVVARPNYDRVAEIGDLLLDFENVAFWYLLEFSPVGIGFVNRRAYELERARFDEVAIQAATQYAGKLDVQPRRLEDKTAAYVMLTPDGHVYGTSGQTEDGLYPLVGSILEDHLRDLAEAIRFQRDPHEDRYRAIETAIRTKRATLVKDISTAAESP